MRFEKCDAIENAIEKCDLKNALRKMRLKNAMRKCDAKMREYDL